MKFLNLILAVFASVFLSVLAMGSAPIESSPPTILLEPTKWSADLPDFVTPEKVATSSQVTGEPSPFGASVLWASDKQTYSVTSTLWERDFRGLRGIDAVALAGIRLNDKVPVWGGGLEWSATVKIARGVNGYASLLIGGLWEQNDALDKVRGFAAFNIGIQVVRF